MSTAGMSTVELITQKLAVLEPQRISIVDESARHAGHTGAEERRRTLPSHHCFAQICWNITASPTSPGLRRAARDDAQEYSRTQRKGVYSRRI